MLDAFKNILPEKKKTGKAMHEMLAGGERAGSPFRKLGKIVCKT